MKTTLLITTFNRAELLKNSLERLTYLTKPDDLLVVDDGSQDNTKQVVYSFEGKLPVRYIYNHSLGWTICSFARNIGIKNTDAEIIITSEPELLFMTDVIAQMLKYHDENPSCVISAGSIYHMQPHTPMNYGFIKDPKSALHDTGFEVHEIQPRSYHPQKLVKTEGWVAPFSALYEKKWLMDINGWDEDFPAIYAFDDTDLLTRLRINGLGQRICNDIECLHQWHNKLPLDTGGHAMKVNDEYYQAKHLDELSVGDPKLKANQTHEWGVIKQQ